MLTLAGPPPWQPWPTLDESQHAAVAHRGPAVLVRGAPGSGKSLTALTCVVDRMDDDGAGEVLLLAPSRRAAAHLRDELSRALVRTTGQPVVRTVASLAYSVLRARAALLGEPAPTLISGPEQDLVLADLLAGHLAGEGAVVSWPPGVPRGALGLRAFRDELRDLLMRAAERGLRPSDLAALGEGHARPAWVAAAAVYAEYLDVTRLRSGTPDAGARFDPAVVLDEATEALLAWADEVPGAPRPRWRRVVVDDYQEATAATARLLHALAQDGTELVLVADPDAAVQTFRGASPALVDRATLPAGSELGAFGATELVLGTVWRHGPAVRAVVRSVTEEIRGPGRAHRAAPSAGAGGAVAGGGGGAVADRGAVAGGGAVAGAGDGGAEVRLLRSPAQEAAYVAYRLRAAHLHDGLAWSSMAVVVRSGAQVAELRRALVGAQVPVSVLGSDLPLRGEAAVRPLLRALGAVLDPSSLNAEGAAALLTSPLGGLDAVGVRRLRRALREEELAGGGGRSSDPLLLEVLADPARGASLPSGPRRAVHLATVLAAGRAAHTRPGSTVLDLLWALWSAARLAEPWQQAALLGGAAGARADRDLDAVLALFTAAEQFVDRMPQASAGAFLKHLQSQDLPADTLAAHGDAAESVALLTAAGAAGRQWELVVVAGVQEGTWPDLRLRDSLLGAQHLVEVLAGRAAPATAGGGAAAVLAAEARAAVLDDELRTFAVAVSRARSRLVVTAVRDLDRLPSALVDLVEPGPAEGPDPRLTTVPAGLDLRAVVAQCRTELEADPRPDHPAAVLLARLAAQQVAGADPDQWYGALEVSTTEPLWSPEGPVPLSPSRLELAATCALRWALETAGGTAADSGEQSLGTLVHAIAAELPTGTAAELEALLDKRWGELGVGDGWLGAVQRRRADSMVRKLAGYLACADPVVAVEHPFEVALGRVVLRGVVDRLEQTGTGPDGSPGLRVIDLKTGRNPVTATDAAHHPQLGAYQLAVEAGGFAEVVPGARADGAGLVFVGTATARTATRRQPALGQDPEPGWARDLVERVSQTVSRSAVAATPNALCRSCPVRRSCPAQPEGRVVGG